MCLDFTCKPQFASFTFCDTLFSTVVWIPFSRGKIIFPTNSIPLFKSLEFTVLIIAPIHYHCGSDWGWKILVQVTAYLFWAGLEYFPWGGITVLQFLLKIIKVRPEERDYIHHFWPVGGDHVQEWLQLHIKLALCRLGVWQIGFDLQSSFLKIASPLWQEIASHCVSLCSASFILL